jgi:hypothetical protein
MCWAAAAANILEYTGWGVAADMTNADEIFQYFQDHWTDNGGLPMYAWAWWFSGAVDVPSGSKWSYVDVPGGGFHPTSCIDDYYHQEANPALAVSAIDAYLHAGSGVVAGIYRGSSGHAISVWGIEYDQMHPNTPQGLWVTDSDDSKNTVDPPNLLRYYDVVLHDSQWYLQDYNGSDEWWIGVVQALGAKPEPYDLLQYATDPEVAPHELTYWVAGNTCHECVVYVVENRYVRVRPSLDWRGVCEVTISVSDGQYQDSDSFMISVQSAPNLGNADTTLTDAFVVKPRVPSGWLHTQGVRCDSLLVSRSPNRRPGSSGHTRHKIVGQYRLGRLLLAAASVNGRYDREASRKYEARRLSTSGTVFRAGDSINPLGEGMQRIPLVAGVVTMRKAAFSKDDHTDRGFSQLDATARLTRIQRLIRMTIL